MKIAERFQQSPRWFLKASVVMLAGVMAASAVRKNLWQPFAGRCARALLARCGRRATPSWLQIMERQSLEKPVMPGRSYPDRRITVVK